MKVFRNRKLRKFLFEWFIESGKKEKELFRERNTYEFHSNEWEKLDKKTYEQMNQTNWIADQLIKLVKPKRKFWNHTFNRLPIISRIYNVYWKIFGRTFKNDGVITLIGKVDKDGNCEYPNTPYYRLTKCYKYLI